MSTSNLIVEKEFLDRSRKLKKLGAGTFGDVTLYDTPVGLRVVKETKLFKKSIGYPKDFLVEMDMLSKFSPLRTVVEMVGVCFDPTDRVGYLFLEPLDMNLSQWAKSVSFDERLENIPVLISKIGGTIGIMHHCSIIHNDIKPNNILVRRGKSENLFKLADFGKSKHVTNSTVPYGGITKYKPPRENNVYSSEYWAFMVVLVEVILGGKRMVKGDNVKLFYRVYMRRGKFRLRDFLIDNLGKQQVNKIPEAFWGFVEPITTSTKAKLVQGLDRIDKSLAVVTIDAIKKRISKRAKYDPRINTIVDEFEMYFNEINCMKDFWKFKQLLSKFLSKTPNLMDVRELRKYAEVVMVTVARKKVKDYKYFGNQKSFLEYQKILLAKLNLQSIII